MKENLNCKVYRDLLPLYAEGLCSEETKALVDAHLESCEDCRRLLSAVPTDADTAAPVPEEGKALKKVSRKIRRSKRLTILLALVLIVIVGTLGYLTTGQILKIGEMQSFETLWRNVELYPIAKMIAKGDFDKAAPYFSEGALATLDLYQHFDELRAQDVENLKTTYQQSYGRSPVKSVRVESYYSETLAASSKIILTDIRITYQDGTELTLEANKEYNSLWSFDVIAYNDDVEGLSEEKEFFQSALNFTHTHGAQPVGFFEKLMTLDGTRKISESRARFIANRFHKDAYDSVEKGINAYLEKGFLTTDCTLSGARYDEETGMLYTILTLTGTDDQGSAILTGRLYYDYQGYYAPSPEDLTVYEQNCTPELADALMHIFG